MNKLYIKILKLIVLFLITAVGVHAQAVLRGKVSDAQSTIAGVSVGVSGVGGATTNVDGCETDSDLAFNINTNFAYKLAKLCYFMSIGYPA